MAVAMVIGIALAVGLFILAPTLITGLFNRWVDSRLLKNVIEGLVRIIIFIVYIWLVSRTKDIRRVFQYHGAEHKSIFCYEKGLELTVENIRPQPKEHPRCGTSFIFVVMIVSLLLLMFVSWTNPYTRILIKLCLIPVIVGISYEINRWARRARQQALASRRAGQGMQKLTVFDPTTADRVAIDAIQSRITQGKARTMVKI
jgi:uncharacterized protein YqhQ